jgi:hypothetical protein
MRIDVIHGTVEILVGCFRGAVAASLTKSGKSGS